MDMGDRWNQREEEHDTLEDMPSNVEIHVKDGIRYVDPYWTAYRTHAKGRWVGCRLVDIFRDEFVSQDPNYWIVVVKIGRIFINRYQMTDVNYVLETGDEIIHFGHRHEHPVLAKPLDFIENNERLLVINKPPSIPVHPCGRYRLNTITGILKAEHGIEGLRILHWLDRTSSGLLIFTKNYETDVEYKEALNSARWQKEFVCKVEGVFPSNEEIVAEAPVEKLVVSMGIKCVKSTGKKAKSIFRRLWTDGQNSVVHCRAETRKGHQIRVHLQYLGYPIIGDQLYNSDVWGPNKGKNAEYGKTYEQLCEDVKAAHKVAHWHETVDPEYTLRLQRMTQEELEEENTDIALDDRPKYDPLCMGCNVLKRIVPPEHFMLYLHCLKYETDKWSFSTELPEWAKNPSEE